MNCDASGSVCWWHELLVVDMQRAILQHLDPLSHLALRATSKALAAVSEEVWNVDVTLLHFSKGRLIIKDKLENRRISTPSDRLRNRIVFAAYANQQQLEASSLIYMKPSDVLTAVGIAAEMGNVNGFSWLHRRCFCRLEEAVFCAGLRSGDYAMVEHLCNIQCPRPDPIERALAFHSLNPGICELVLSRSGFIDMTDFACNAVWSSNHSVLHWALNGYVVVSSKNADERGMDQLQFKRQLDVTFRKATELARELKDEVAVQIIEDARLLRFYSAVD